jgi:hypothetical protein
MTRQPTLWRSVTASLRILSGLLLVGAAAEGASLTAARTDTMRLQLVPHVAELAAGDTLRVELVVPQAGPTFNAYDAHVAYDPTVLTFLRRPNSEQEGPLMTGACGQTFHLFSVAPDSTYLTINHSLLCAGMSLTGPGVLYRLQFIGKHVDADTWLRLLREPPTVTAVYDAGIYVLPLTTIGAAVRVGAGSVSTVPPAPGDGLRLDVAPNPFNPRTTFTYELPAAAAVDLSVYGLDGRRLRRLESRRAPAGPHAVAWDGRDDAGRTLPAGVYLARLRADGRTAAKRICLVK